MGWMVCLLDMKEFEKVYNEYLEEEITLYQKILEDGNIEIRSWAINGNQYFFLHGIINEELFKQIVGGIKPYEK